MELESERYGCLCEKLSHSTIRHVGTLRPARYSHPAFLPDLLICYASSGMVLGFVRATTMKFLEPTSASRRPAFGDNVRLPPSAARRRDHCNRSPSRRMPELTEARGPACHRRHACPLRLTPSHQSGAASPIVGCCATAAAPHRDASATTSSLLPASFLSGEREKEKRRNERLREERKRLRKRGGEKKRKERKGNREEKRKEKKEREIERGKRKIRENIT
jgi:hypothetical protein